MTDPNPVPQTDRSDPVALMVAHGFSVEEATSALADEMLAPSDPVGVSRVVAGLTAEMRALVNITHEPIRPRQHQLDLAHGDSPIDPRDAAIAKVFAIQRRPVPPGLDNGWSYTDGRNDALGDILDILSPVAVGITHVAPTKPPTITMEMIKVAARGLAHPIDPSPFDFETAAHILEAVEHVRLLPDSRDDAIARVLALHTKNDAGECSHCYTSTEPFPEDAQPVQWPCPTAVALTGAGRLPC